MGIIQEKKFSKLGPPPGEAHIIFYDDEYHFLHLGTPPEAVYLPANTPQESSPLPTYTPNRPVTQIPTTRKSAGLESFFSQFTFTPSPGTDRSPGTDHTTGIIFFTSSHPSSCFFCGLVTPHVRGNWRPDKYKREAEFAEKIKRAR